MGQRSQIYLRVIDSNNEVHLIANYYQWNYGERMISRIRHFLEYIEDYLNEGYLDKNFCMFELKFSRLLDTNFDIKDIVPSLNIIDEYKEYCANEPFNDYVFLGQDNNDGQAYIDVNTNKRTIKYCFSNYDDIDKMPVLSPEQYMNWDCGEDWMNFQRVDYTRSYFEKMELLEAHKEMVEYTLNNINYLKNFQLMNEDELYEFISYDYSSLLNETK